MSLLKGLCAVSMAAAMAACSGDGPVAPDRAAISLSGTWAGQVREQPGERAGTLSVTIEQTGAAIAGSFVVRFADPAFDRAGTISGLLGPATSAVALSPDAADCQTGRVLGGSVMNMTWTRTGDTLLGTYEGFACFGQVAGSFELERRP